MSHRRPLIRTVTAGVVALASALSLAACMDDGTTPATAGTPHPHRRHRGGQEPVAGLQEEGRGGRGEGRHRVLHRLHPAQPRAGPGRHRHEPVPAHPVPREVQRGVRGHPRPRRRDGDLPPRPVHQGDRSVSAVAAAGRVAIPNDQTNQGRAINVLASAGLVTLKSKDKLTPTPADIDTGRSKVTVVPVDAAQTATAFNDGTPAVINNNFLSAAGVTAADAVAKDDPKQESAKPYINVFVTTEARKDDPTIAKLVEIWHDPEVQKAVSADSQGTAVEVNTSPRSSGRSCGRPRTSSAPRATDAPEPPPDPDLTSRTMMSEPALRTGTRPDARTGTSVEFRNVTKTFHQGRKEVTALDDVSVTIPSGSIVGVIGYSGAGKSTLVRQINGLDKPTSGQILLDGRDIVPVREAGLRALRADIGMIFQQFNLLSSRTVEGNVAYPWRSAGSGGRSAAAASRRCWTSSAWATGERPTRTSSPAARSSASASPGRSRRTRRCCSPTRRRPPSTRRRRVTSSSSSGASTVSSG